MGHDEVFIPFAVAAITPLGCAWVASRFVSPTNKWIYSGVIVGTAYLSWKYIVPRMLTSMGYPVPFEAESFGADGPSRPCNAPDCNNPCYAKAQGQLSEGKPVMRYPYLCEECIIKFHPDVGAESFSADVIECNYCDYNGEGCAKCHNCNSCCRCEGGRGTYDAESFGADWDEDGYAEKQAVYLRRLVEGAMRNGCWTNQESMEIVEGASDLGMSIVESDYFRNREAESFGADTVLNQESFDKLMSQLDIMTMNELYVIRHQAQLRLKEMGMVFNAEAMTQDDHDNIICSQCNVNVEDDPIYAEFILRCDCGNILYEDNSDGPYNITDYYGAESFGAESKFIRPYDGKHGIKLERDNKGRYRRKLSVPLKKR